MSSKSKAEKKARRMTFNKIQNVGDLYRIEADRSVQEIQKDKLKDYSNCRETTNILQNWKRWMEIRKQFHENARIRMGRDPKQLVMNRSDAYRKKMQDRLKLLYARIPKPSKERGSLAFWKMPVELKHPCLPPLFAVLTKEERFQIPEIDFAGVPDCILKEKGIKEDEVYVPEMKGKTSLKDMWEESSYRKHRVYQFAKTIKKIQNLEPDIDHLCVIGHNQENLQRVAVRTEPLEEVSKTSTEASDFANDDIIVGLEIGDTAITSKLEEQTTQKYYVCIDYYIPDDGVIKHEIPVKNIGNVVIKFNWTRILKEKQLDIIPKRNPTVAFCFKKKRTVLMMGESSKIDIYFQIDKPGFYEETWELVTYPDISSNARFLLVLWAFAEVANYEEICKSIHDRIDEGVKQKIVDDIIVRLLARVQVEKPEEYLPTYRKEIREENIFNSLNLTQDGPLRNKVYYYEEHICSALKQMYASFKRPEDPPEWDLDLKKLAKVIQNIEDLPTRQFVYLSYKIIADKMLKTSCLKNRKKEVFEHVYYLFCATIDQITEYIFKIRERFGVVFKEKYPKPTIDSVLEEATKKKYHEIEFFPDSTDKPSRNLKVLEKFECTKLDLVGSIQTPEMLYKSYFKEKYNIEIKLADEKEGKGKKGKDKKGKDKGKGKAKGKKEKGSDKSSKSNKSKDKSKVKSKESKKQIREEPKAPIVNVPELKLEDLISSSESSSEESSDEPADGSLTKRPSQLENSDLYYYNLYMVTYELLSRFVEDLVCTVDGFNERILPPFLLKFILEQPQSKWKQDHGDYQKAFDIDDDHYDAESVLSDLLSSESFSFLHSDEDMAPANLTYADIFTQTSGDAIYPDRYMDNLAQTIETDDIDKDVLIERLELEKDATSVHSIHSTI